MLMIDKKEDIRYTAITAPRLAPVSRGLFCYSNLMRRIVLIDGENLVYGLRHLLGSPDERLPGLPLMAMIIEG